MCRYMSDRRAACWRRSIESGRLRGQPLNDVLAWSRPATGAGCYCEPDEPHAQVGPGARNDSLRAGAGAARTDRPVTASSAGQSSRERPLLGDGAMGTQLMIAGLEQGNCGEAWNLTHPERVLAIQRRYAEAGSDCILTNTFGGSRIMLNRHGHRRRRRRDQPGGRGDRARGVWRPGRAGCSATSGRSAA